MTTNEVDLNSDLGEGFGIWTAGRRRRPARRRHQRQRGLRLPRRRPGDHAPHLRGRRSSAGVAIGAQVSLPGPGRVRPRGDRRATRSELRREVLYQLGALDGIARAGAAGSATSSRTARSTTDLPTTRAGRGGGGRGASTTTRRCRCSGCPARPCCELAGGGRAADRRRGLRRPRLHRRTARWSPAGRRARCSTTRPRSRERSCGMATGRHGDRGRRRRGPGGRPLDLRARRHPRRGRAGAARARRLGAAGVTLTAFADRSA